jgi:molybdopterin converting factor small subunit
MEEVPTIPSNTYKYTFTIKEKEYKVYFSELETPSGMDRETYLVNMFCNDLIKKSAPDILPNLLKDCKTINDIKKKLPNVEYEYDKTRTKQLTLKLGDVEFSVPFKNSLSDEDKIAISRINLPNTNQSKEGEIPAFPSPLEFDGDDATRNIPAKPNTLKDTAFKSIELFDAESFKGIKIGGRSSVMRY